MIPILYDKTETSFTSNGIGRLADAVSCVIEEERNGIFELTMTYPMTGLHYADLEEERYIFAQPRPGASNQAFKIYKISKPLNGIVTVSARHISYQLNKVVVMPFTAGSCTAAFVGLKNNSVGDNPFTFYTDKSVTASFKVTVPSTLRSLLGGVEGSILDQFGTGEYEWDMYTVRFLLHRGNDNGVTIRYGKNLTDLKNDTNTENVYTAIVPFYANESTTVTLPERILYGDHVDDYSLIMVEPVDFSEKFGENVPTEAQLRSAAETFLEQSSNWKISENITVSFVNLADTEEYKNVAALQRVNLCDTVTIVHSELGVEAQAKVIKVEYDVLNGRYNSIQLGDTTANLAQTIVESSGFTRQIVTKTALQQAIEHATQLITGGLGGHIVINRNADGQPEEILIMDTDDVTTAVNVWRWNLGGLGHSHNGYNGPFSDVALTADGQINANLITTGALDAGLITTGLLASPTNPETYWDLDAGIFHMSASTAQQIAAYVDANGWYFATPYTIDENFVAFFQVYLQNGDLDVTHEFAAYDYLWYQKDDFNIRYLSKGYWLQYDLHDLPYGGTIICVYDPQQYWTLEDDELDEITTSDGDPILMLSNLTKRGQAELLTFDGDFILDDENDRIAADTIIESKALRVENDFTNGVKTMQLEISVDGLRSTVQAIGSDQSLMKSDIRQTAEAIVTEVSRAKYAEQTLTSQINQTAGSIALSVTNGSDSSVLSLSYTDTEGHVISLASETIEMTGLVKFTDLSTSGSTTINGDNITTGYLSASRISGGTLTLGGSNNTNGTMSIQNASGNTFGTWDNSGLYVMSPNSFRTSITTDGKLHVYRYNSGWKEIGNLGQFGVTVNARNKGTTQTYNNVFTINALSANTPGFAIAIDGVPYYAMNTSDTAGAGMDLTERGFRHYFKGEIYCDSTFKTWVGYGWTGNWSDYSWQYGTPEVGTGGNVAIWRGDNAGNLVVEGTIYRYNTPQDVSDRREKHDIEDLVEESSLELIMGLKPVSFRFNYSPDALHHGFIAQDVDEVAPWNVTKPEDGGTMTIAYQDFIADLVKVVQYQEERIRKLEAEHG